MSEGSQKQDSSSVGADQLLFSVAGTLFLISLILTAYGIYSVYHHVVSEGPAIWSSTWLDGKEPYEITAIVARSGGLFLCYAPFIAMPIPVLIYLGLRARRRAEFRRQPEQDTRP